MSRHLIQNTLTALSCLFVLMLGANESQAAGPRIRGTLGNVHALHLGQPIYLSLETREGLEQITLRLDSTYRATPSLSQLIGEVRPRKGRGSPTAVAASRIGRRFVVYFTSSRRGVPTTASFSLLEREGALIAKSVRLARAPRFALPCGSGRAHQVQRARYGRSQRSAQVLGDSIFTPFSPPRVLEIATRADYDFYLLYGEASNDYIAASLHAAEVLYAAPLGVRFRLANQQVQTYGAPSQGAAVGASFLLEAFRQQVMREPANYDIFHLFTGKNLNGRTIGIAYVRSACSGRTRFNIGLSRAISEPLQPILFAHEIAHNLGAYHDTEPNSVMNPVLTAASTQFSGTSLTSMKAAISSSLRCLSKLPEHQATLSLANSLEQSFSASVGVMSLRAEECSLGLYAQAQVAGKPYGPFYLVSSKKGFLNVGKEPSVTSFTAPTPQGPAQPSDVGFQVKIWCRSRTYLSNTQVIQVSAGSTGASSVLPTDGRAWILLLRKAFEG